MKKYECNIVQDLLPNYIEKLTSENTNEYITKHLLECKQCSNIHNKLNNDSNNYEVKSERFVNYSKKFKFRFNFLKCIVIFILMILIINIIRNIVIIESLSSKSEKYENETSYYSLYQEYEENALLIIESYNYNNKYYRTMRDIDKITGETFFAEEKYDGENVRFYSKNADGYEGTITQDEGSILAVEPRSYYLEDNDIITKIRNYILCDIQSVTYNGIECYRFTNLSYHGFGVNTYIYMSKETGLPVRISSENIEGGYRQTQELSFEFNAITEEMINELIK